MSPQSAICWVVFLTVVSIAFIILMSYAGSVQAEMDLFFVSQISL